MENYLAHYGIKMRSGRYPYGSGDDPYQRIKRSGFSKNKKKKIIQKAKQEVREKSVSEMTDKEIQTRIARMKLEADYERQRNALNSYDAQLPVSQPSSRPSYYGKSISDMSDDELGSYLSRLRLEQEVKRLTQVPTKQKSTWLSDTLKDTGKMAVKEFLTGTTKYGTERLVGYIKEQDKKYQESKKPSWLGKSVSQMTDSELTKYINRMTNEDTANKINAKKSYKGKKGLLDAMSDLELDAYRQRLDTEDKVKKLKTTTPKWETYKYKKQADLNDAEIEALARRAELVYKINNPGSNQSKKKKKK